MPSRTAPQSLGISGKADAMRTQRLLRRKAASDYLREIHGLERAPSTLAKLAVIGGGPVFRRAGRIPLYSPDDLDCWAESLLSAHTFDFGGGISKAQRV
jgi:hypothetical protein